MGIKTTIQDGGGSKRSSYVTKDNALKVRVTQGSFDDLTREESERQKLLYEIAENNGSTNMNVNGSLESPTTFRMESSQDQAKFVQEIRFVLESKRLSLQKPAQSGILGDAGLLNNGIEVSLRQGGVRRLLFPNPIRQLSSFLLLADDFINVESAISNNVDLFIATIKLPAPVIILPASKDEFEIRIRDDLSELDRFEALFIGVSEEISDDAGAEVLEEELQE